MDRCRRTAALCSRDRELVWLENNSTDLLCTCTHYSCRRTFQQCVLVLEQPVISYQMLINCRNSLLLNMGVKCSSCAARVSGGVLRDVVRGVAWSVWWGVVWCDVGTAGTACRRRRARCARTCRTGTLLHYIHFLYLSTSNTKNKRRVWL